MPAIRVSVVVPSESLSAAKRSGPTRAITSSSEISSEEVPIRAYASDEDLPEAPDSATISIADRVPRKRDRVTSNAPIESAPTQCPACMRMTHAGALPIGS